MDVRMMGALALTIVVAAIIISMGAEILTQLQSQQTAQSYSYNVTTYGLTGMSTFGTWIPLIALVVVASIVIGVIVRYMSGAGG